MSEWAFYLYVSLAAIGVGVLGLVVLLLWNRRTERTLGDWIDQDMENTKGGH